MFTKVCLIHKDNDNIRNELEKLGIKPHPCMCDGNNNFLFVNRGFYNNIETGYEEESLRAIDCGENEELFLAIAALRDDTDKSQWFVNGEGLFFKSFFEEFRHFKIEDKAIGKIDQGIEDIHIPKCYSPIDIIENTNDWHKATVKELKEYFN